jgi:hypothetical protein
MKKVHMLMLKVMKTTTMMRMMMMTMVMKNQQLILHHQSLLLEMLQIKNIIIIGLIGIELPMI